MCHIRNVQRIWHECTCPNKVEMEASAEMFVNVIKPFKGKAVDYAWQCPGWKLLPNT
jgi:hypothetical protein